MKFENVQELILWYLAFCELEGNRSGTFDTMCAIIAQTHIPTPLTDIADLPGEDEMIAKVDIDRIMGSFTERERQTLLLYATRGNGWATVYYCTPNHGLWHLDNWYKEEPKTNGFQNRRFGQFMRSVEDAFIEADYLVSTIYKRGPKKFCSM